jgi:hypothetical protein
MKHLYSNQKLATDPKFKNEFTNILPTVGLNGKKIV